MQSMAGIITFDGNQNGEQGRAWHTVLILPLDRSKSSSFQRIPSEWDLHKQMGAAEHASPNFHCDRHYILIQHFSTPTRQERKNTKHTGTKKLQCLLAGPSNISPRKVSPKKAQKGSELTQTLTWGKEFIP